MTDHTDNRRPFTFKFDDMDGDDRLAELILHIAKKCEDNTSFGATKLNKILCGQIFYPMLGTASLLQVSNTKG